LPEPVGAQINVWPPEAIAGHPAAWAGVGASNDAWNHFLTGSEKGSRGDFWVADVLMPNLLTLPIRELGSGERGGRGEFFRHIRKNSPTTRICG